MFLGVPIFKHIRVLLPVIGLTKKTISYWEFKEQKKCRYRWGSSFHDKQPQLDLLFVCKFNHMYIHLAAEHSSRSTVFANSAIFISGIERGLKGYTFKWLKSKCGSFHSDGQPSFLR